MLYHPSLALWLLFHFVNLLLCHCLSLSPSQSLLKSIHSIFIMVLPLGLFYLLELLPWKSWASLFRSLSFTHTRARALTHALTHKVYKPVIDWWSKEGNFLPAVVFEAKGQIMASAKLARKDLIFPKPRRQSGIKTHFGDKSLSTSFLKQTYGQIRF